MPPPGQAPGGLGCMASCPSFASRALRSCDFISRLIICARLSAAFHGASAAASARASASSAFHPRSTGGGAAANRPRASRPALHGVCPSGACPTGDCPGTLDPGDAGLSGSHARRAGARSSGTSYAHTRSANARGNQRRWRINACVSPNRRAVTMQCRVCTRYSAPGPVCAYFPCVVCARATLARPSAVRGPVLFPPWHLHRPFAIAGARQAQPVARTFAPQRGARWGLPRGLPLRSGPSRPPGRGPVPGCGTGACPARRVNRVRGGGGGGRGCDGGHLRSSMPVVSVDILT